MLVRTRRFAASLLLASAAVTITGCQTERPTQAIRENADVLFNRGDYPAAAEEYKIIVGRYPGDWQAQYRLGVSLTKSNQLSAARRSLEIAHTRNPQDENIASALAEVLFLQGDTNRLFAFLRERADQTRSVSAYLRLAEYADEAGDPDSAKTALDTAIEVDGGKSVEPYLKAAAFEQRLGNLDAAARRLRQAFGINPEDIRVRQRMTEMGESLDPSNSLPPGR